MFSKFFETDNDKTRYDLTGNPESTDEIEVLALHRGKLILHYYIMNVKLIL